MFTVHHLQRSQSERILWLCEELGIDYDLVLHKRAPLLSPPSLKAIHKLGTAPAIVDGDLTLSESGACAEYIIRKYGHGKFIVSPTSKDYPTYLFWYYFTLTSLQPMASACMYEYLVDGVPEDAKKLPRSRFQRNLGLVEDRLGEVPFLVGEEFTLADMMIVWVFTTFRTFLPYSLKPYPNILAYVQKLATRDAYRKAMAKGDHGLELMHNAETSRLSVF